MKFVIRALAGFALALIVAFSGSAQDKREQAKGNQEDDGRLNSRRERDQPELVIESGGRTGTCDALVFSDDGRYLFAAGDDKVVRVWPNGPAGLDGSKMQTLRWPSWREQRGGIKALAVSPDGEHVAIGGFGLRVSTVAVINRRSGEIEDIIAPKPTKQGENFFAVMSAAFSPNGKEVAFTTADGSVWLWQPGKTPKPWRARTLQTSRDGALLWYPGKFPRQQPKRLGRQTARSPEPGSLPVEFNRIRLVGFLADSRDVFTVAQTGQIQFWDRDVKTAAVRVTDEDKGKMIPRSAERGDASPVFRAVRNGDWLAVGGSSDSELIMYNLRSQERISHAMKKGEFVRALAFDQHAKRLAVAFGSLNTGSRYLMDADDRIALFDQPTDPTKKLEPKSGPPTTYRVEALAFDPRGRLAIASGENHEVILWDLESLSKPLSVIRGKGRNLWGVGISTDGSSVRFQSELNNASTDPNKRGRGPWLDFNLKQAKRPTDVKQWVEPLETADGWSVVPDPKNRYVWWAVHKDNPQGGFQLTLDKNRDEAPRCYTFLKKEGADKPTRVIVGHYYGCSLFELTQAGATRKFLYVGHAGEVMSVAPSKNQKWFVTCGTDQTLAAWSVDDWKSNPKFGSAFEIKGGKLLVKSVDVGSPAWESGLIAGDEIVLTVLGANSIIYNRSGKYGEPAGTPEKCLEKLNNPTPGVYIALGWKRDGGARIFEQITFLPRRPLWRFFPSFNEQNAFTDWIVWMWNTSCYYTSTNGHFQVGWHVNHPSLEGTPKFYRAEQFQKQFKKPLPLVHLIADQDLEKAIGEAIEDRVNFASFGKLEPAPVRIEPREPVIGPNGVELTLKVRQRGTNPDLLPDRVDLWINDYRYRSWKTDEQEFRHTITIPLDQLRDGKNQITLQTFNRLGGRGEDYVVAEVKPGANEPRLFGLFVGVNDYKNSYKRSDGTKALGDLTWAVNDATRLYKLWQQQVAAKKPSVPEGTDAPVESLFDEDVSQKAIVKRLEEFAKRARPNDVFVLFLSGHGDLLEPEAKKGDEPPPSVFIYCCPEYDRNNYRMTGMPIDLLVEKLAAIPCRKLVLIDACHSGQAATTNLVQHLVPNGKGPTVIAACDQSEFAFEHKKFDNGLFTFAVREALGAQFAKADADGDGKLDPGELFQYVRNRIPELLVDVGENGKAQIPICFPDEPEKFTVAKKR